VSLCSTASKLKPLWVMVRQIGLVLIAGIRGSTFAPFIFFYAAALLIGCINRPLLILTEQVLKTSKIYYQGALW